MKKSGKHTQGGSKKLTARKTDGVIREFVPFEQYKHYDQNLEEAVLGICLLESDAMARIRRFLAPEMFYYQWHQSVYRAMSGLFDDGLPIDILTVINRIANDMDEYTANNWHDGRKIADSLYWLVSRLTNAVVSSAHLDYWAYLIREQYIQRELILLTTGGNVLESGRDELVRVQARINDLMNFRISSDEWVHVSTLLVQLWQHMTAVFGKSIVGLPSGFKYLDTITSGITPGLYYLGARPSVGKTAFAVKMAINMAHNQDPVGIISLETPGVKLAGRILSMLSKVDFWRIWRNKMSEEMSKKLFADTGEAFNLPIWISDNPATDLTDIRAKAFQLHKRGAKCIFIDYLQLVNPDEDAGTREQEVATLSRGLKLLSMQLNIPIIALAQLSRESERRQDKTPRLIDLRESGSLEQDADGVMLLHRPEKSGIMADEGGESLKGKAVLIVAKWRDGETFDHPLLFNGDRMEFEEDQAAIEEQHGWQFQSRQPETKMIPPGRDYTEGQNSSNSHIMEDF